MPQPTNAQFTHAFRLLGQSLPKKPLPRRAGPATVAEPGEFMLMDLAQGFYRFKHADTRNYLLVRIDNGEIVIPERAEAFFEGRF